MPSLRLPQPGATTEPILAEVIAIPTAPQDTATAHEDSMEDIPAPKNLSGTESKPFLEQQRQQQPLEAEEMESPHLYAGTLPLDVQRLRRRYFVFNMLRKSLDEKLGISFQEADGVDGGMEVKQINDARGDASENRLLAARWNEAMLTTFPENALQPGDVAYKLHDGAPFNKDAIYSVLPNTLDIWIVFYREEGPSFSFTISEDAPGTLVKVQHPEVKDLEVAVTVPASRKAGDVWRVIGARA